MINFDNFGLVYEVTVIIVVLDKDDTAPEIIDRIEPIQGFVPQNPEPGLQILELTITDRDALPDIENRRWAISLGKLDF